MEGVSIVPTRGDEQGGVVLCPDVVVGGVLGHVLVEATDVGEMGVCVVGGWAMWGEERRSDDEEDEDENDNEEDDEEDVWPSQKSVWARVKWCVLPVVGVAPLLPLGDGERYGPVKYQYGRESNGVCYLSLGLPHSSHSVTVSGMAQSNISMGASQMVCVTCRWGCPTPPTR